MTYYYFVGQYVNQQGHPLAAPILLRKVARGLTVEEAEKLTDRLNREAGHTVDDVELMLSSPNAQFFMYDDDERIKNSAEYEDNYGMDAAADFAFDAAREDAVFGRGRGGRD